MCVCVHQSRYPWKERERVVTECMYGDSTTTIFEFQCTNKKKKYIYINDEEILYAFMTTGI